MWSHLNNCVHFGAPHCTKDIGTLKKIQQKTPKCSEAVSHEIKEEAETAVSLHPQEKAQDKIFTTA